MTESRLYVSSGVRVVGTRGDAIVCEALRIRRSPGPYRRMSSVRNAYGDGRAARRIARIIRRLGLPARVRGG